jgi:hypothetical protein
MEDRIYEGRAVTAKRFLGVEDLEVYKKFIYNLGSAIKNAFVC